MKRFISLFFTLGITLSFAHAQKVEVVSLQTTDYKRLKTDFYIEEVEDRRDDKEYIGVVQKGLSNKKRPAKLGDSFRIEIITFLRHTISKKSERRPLKMLVHKLWISEKTLAASERGFVDLVIEFQEKTDSVYTSLGIYETSQKVRGMDVTLKHGENIRSAFLVCLDDFINGKPSATINLNAERLDFTLGIPDTLAIGFYTSFNALVYNEVREETPKVKTRQVNDLVLRYNLRNTNGKKMSDYAYYTGEILLLNAYQIGVGARYYLAPSTRGRYLVFVDKYARPAAGAAFGLLGAAASTKTRASVLDTSTGMFSECKEKVMINLLKEHQDLLDAYSKTLKNPADQIAVIQQLNDLLMKTDLD